MYLNIHILNIYIEKGEGGKEEGKEGEGDGGVCMCVLRGYGVPAGVQACAGQMQKPEPAFGRPSLSLSTLLL